MLSAVIAAFLYLRLVVAMWMQAPDEATAEADDALEVPWGSGLAIGVAVTVTLVVGVMPWIVLDWADKAVPVLTAITGG